MGGPTESEPRPLGALSSSREMGLLLSPPPQVPMPPSCVSLRGLVSGVRVKIFNHGPGPSAQMPTVNKQGLFSGQVLTWLVSHRAACGPWCIGPPRKFSPGLSVWRPVLCEPVRGQWSLKSWASYKCTRKVGCYVLGTVLSTL